MAFDWRDYYDLASELAQRPDEASQRTAISRAYYSAFCSAQKRLMERDRTFRVDPDAGSHHAVWLWYTRHPSPVCKAIGQDGFRLKQSRRAADYDEDFAALPQSAARALSVASRILQRLNNI